MSGGGLGEVLRDARRCETPRCMTTWGHDGGHVLVGGVPPSAEMRPLDRRLGDAALSWVAARLAEEETRRIVRDALEAHEEFGGGAFCSCTPTDEDEAHEPIPERWYSEHQANIAIAAVRGVLVGEDE